MKTGSFLTVLGAFFFSCSVCAAQDVKFLAPGSRDSAPEAQKINYDSNGGAFLSEQWISDFEVPPRVWRPLQIVHGRDLTDPKTVDYFKDRCGLGGLVVNVGGDGYIRKEENWKRFVQGVRNLKDAGLRVWIYDEDGYPSLEAGGVALEGHPELQALELARDPEHDPEFYVRDCYEFTHSSNNYARSRRYPNPLNPAATQRFLDVTHRRYREELGKELYDYVEAFFTDEPSMMAANLGAIGDEEARSRVPVFDPIDPNKKCLPVVSWYDDVEAKYLEKYGEALRPHFASLFSGDGDADKQIRRQFWALLGELDGERYYGQIREFCREDPEGPVASGHTLHEENILMHVPLDGNKLDVLKKFDIPGLDVLNSDPSSYFYGSWRTAAFPCSAAEFNGSRRVMTEVSDFSQLHSGERRPVDLATMEATAAWQASFGVTDFNLYYSITGAPYRNEETHRDYCRFVGRLNAALLDARPVRPILLYYPIDELQAEFIPVAKRYDLDTQSARVRSLVSSFNILGSHLCRVQASFCVADRKTLENLTKNPNDKEEAERLAGKYSGVIFPFGSDKIDFDWSDPNFRVLRSSEENPFKTREDEESAIRDFVAPRLVSTPPMPDCVEGTFERDGRLIFVMTNSIRERRAGKLELVGFDVEFESDEWFKLDPDSGEVVAFAASGGAFEAEFNGLQTLVFVSPKMKKE